MKQDLIERVEHLVAKYHVIDEESDRTGTGWDGVMHEHGLDGCAYAHALVELFEATKDHREAAILREEYGNWGEHPDHQVSDWKYEADNGDTRLGYWEWVAEQRRLKEPT